MEIFQLNKAFDMLFIIILVSNTEQLLVEDEHNTLKR